MGVFFNTFSKVLGFLFAFLAFFIFLILIVVFLIPSINSSNFHENSNNKSKNKIGILKLAGPIISESNIFYNFTNINAIYPSLVEGYLEEFKKQEVLGIIISINSPGGSVSASNEIFNQINNFKKNNNIEIYFHSNDMLASGAYWISMSGNKIYASYGSLIGSIGVKGPDWIYYNSPNLLSSGFLGNTIESEKGIKLFSNTAGKSKDILNPFRMPTQEETDNLQEMVDQIYQDFITLVSSNRKIEKKILINDIGAMIYNSNEAKKNYLIDGVKNLEGVVEILKKKLKINDFKIITNESKFRNLSLSINYSKDNNKKINTIFCNNIKNQFSVAIVNAC